MTFKEILLIIVGGGFFVAMMYVFIRALFLPNPSVGGDSSKEQTVSKGKAKA